MSKILIIATVLIFVAVGGWALELDAAFEMGYDYLWNIYTVGMDVGLRQRVRMDRLYFDLVGKGSFDVLTTLVPGTYSFQPQMNIYGVEFGIERDIVGIYWQHFCVHPGDIHPFIMYSYDDLYLQAGERVLIRFDSRKRNK